VGFTTYYYDPRADATPEEVRVGQEKAARANSMYRDIQLAHIRGVMGTHHSPSLEQMLESYQQAFETYIARPGRSLAPERPDRNMPENVLRLLSTEAVVIQDILAQCYNADCNFQNYLAQIFRNYLAYFVYAAVGRAPPTAPVRLLVGQRPRRSVYRVSHAAAE